tara:strand:+ start:705 stop:1250 length:546 start_codon:yes stop_codon:yes gene_type:complete
MPKFKKNTNPIFQGQVNPPKPEYRPDQEQQMLEDAGAFRQGSGFKMKGPTFFQKSMKKYGSAMNQGTTLPTGLGGPATPETIGEPTSLVQPDDVIEGNAQAYANTLAAKKDAAGGRKYMPGGSPTTQVNPKPAKRGAGNLSWAQMEFEATKGMSGAPTTQRRKPKDAKDKHDRKLNPNRDI